MGTKWVGRVLLLTGMATLGSAAVDAETDVEVSLYGAFNGTTTGNGVAQSPSNSAGGLLEARRIAKPWIGYEGSYSFNRANQVYNQSSYVCPGALPCTFLPTAAVSANAHEVTGDWIASLKIANLRPFALAGGGLLFNVPSGSAQAPTRTSTQGVFVYGGGGDWELLPHIGLRFQYRGNLYKAPNLTTLYTSTGAFTHTSEPVIGAYFRF
jgi:hypothetical protein